MKTTAAAALVLTLLVRVWAAQSLPERLSETGLYLGGTTTVDLHNRPYSPQYPLWTDGAHKRRWVQLPAGTPIDARDVDRWEFPVGTRFWKEFAFNGRKVETRLLWRSSADAWSFAAYVWNEAQTDATLAPAEGIRNVVEVAPGKRHSIPSIEDCRACHENERTRILGFTALQLSTDRDPAAPHREPLGPEMVTLRTLVADEAFTPPRPELASQPPRIPGDSRTRAALGYLTGNCGHCHNEESWVATVRYPLLMPYASHAQIDHTIRALLASTTKWDIPHTEPGTTKFVTAGAPDLSALFVRMRSRRPSSQMPPLGTVVQDGEAVELLSAWIRDLAAAHGTR
jgi:cytochrome c553